MGKANGQTPAPKLGPLGRRLRARVERDGPMPFRDWMAACLYDPEHGFYVNARHPAGVGRGTHFATAPTLHPFFATCLARELQAAWKAAGSPGAWDVVEFGAGTGALARDAIKELKRLGVPATWSAIDVQPGQPIKGGRWLATPPARYDAVVANEFLDALPFDLLQWQDGAWRELGVGLGTSDAGFGWAVVGRATGTEAWPAGQPGERRVRMDAVAPWLDGVAKAGATLALIVDYGERRPANDARGFAGHDFADVLGEPGAVDLTADVDFAELAELSQRLGFVVGLETQEAFLVRHGVFDVLNRLDRTSLEGASSYLRLRQLLLPTGLGAAFKVARLERASQGK